MIQIADIPTEYASDIESALRDCYWRCRHVPDLRVAVLFKDARSYRESFAEAFREQEHDLRRQNARAGTTWKQWQGRVTFANGAQIQAYLLSQPDSIRGVRAEIVIMPRTWEPEVLDIVSGLLMFADDPMVIRY